MGRRQVLLGIVEISVWGPEESGTRGLPTNARIEISCRDLAAGVAEKTLKAWAYDELGGDVLPEDD